MYGRQHDRPQLMRRSLGCTYEFFGHERSTLPDSVYADLRTQHWTEEKKSFPDSSCSIMNPPPGKAVGVHRRVEGPGRVVHLPESEAEAVDGRDQGDHGQGDRPYALNRPY